MKIIFIRHADPCKDSFSITSKGKEECFLLSKQLKEKGITKLYSGTSLRTSETVTILSKECGGIPVEQKEWLNEFKHYIKTGDGEKRLLWEMPTIFWCNDDMLSLNKCMESAMFESGSIKEAIETINGNLDSLLSMKGYERSGKIYLTQKGNYDAIVIVSHFATISIMLSHLLNISPLIMLNSFWMAPTSVTTLVSEEIERGKVVFRLIGYNDVDHLSNRDDIKSYYGLQQEVFEGEEK